MKMMITNTYSEYSIESEVINRLITSLELDLDLLFVIRCAKPSVDKLLLLVKSVKARPLLLLFRWISLSFGLFHPIPLRKPIRF